LFWIFATIGTIGLWINIPLAMKWGINGEIDGLWKVHSAVIGGVLFHISTILSYVFYWLSNKSDIKVHSEDYLDCDI